MKRSLRMAGSVVFGAADTTKTFPIYVNGKLTDVSLAMPNFTNALTATLTIEDEAGVVLYTKVAIAKNATTTVSSLVVPVDTNYVGRLVLSGAPGGTGGTVSVKLWVNAGMK